MPLKRTSADRHVASRFQLMFGKGWMWKWAGAGRRTGNTLIFLTENLFGKRLLWLTVGSGDGGMSPCTP